MLLGNLERFIGSLFNSNARDNNYEFSESIFLVQFKNGSQINIGFSCAGLHFDSKVHSLFTEALLGRLWQTISQLNLLNV